MNTSKAGDEAYRETAARLQELARDDIPKTMRALAEENIAHTREIYERSKHALEAVLDSWERTFGAAGQGAVALNHKIIDIAQRNINSGFDLAKSMTAAKNIAEATELQAAYWCKQLDTLTAQAEEVRVLSTQVAADAGEPIKTQVRRESDQARRAT
jgi:hypothetical protein